MAERLGTLTEIADAIRQTDVVQQRTKEINDFAVEKMNEIEGKAQEALETIPEDYQQLVDDVSRLSESMTDISEGLEKSYDTFDVINKLNVVGGLYPSGDDSDTPATQSYLRTKYIRVYAGWELEYTLLCTSNMPMIVVYDTNKEMVDSVMGTSATASGSYTFASDGYFRMCGKAEKISTFKAEITSNLSNVLNEIESKIPDIDPIEASVKNCEDDIKTLFERTDEKPIGEKDVTTNFQLTPNSVISSANGEVMSTTATVNYTTTDYIEVFDNTSVIYQDVTPKSTAIIAQYDKNKKFISAIDGTGATVSGEYNCSKGYIRMTFRTDRIADRRVFATVVYSDILKIGMLGDSVTWGRIGGTSGVQQTEKGIPYWVGEITGNVVDNLGVGSMGWISHQYLETNAMEYVRALDFSKYDFVTLAWGLNDGDIALGTYTDTDGTTIMGAVFDVCNYIMTQNPKIQLILIAPTVGKGSAFPYYNPNGQHTASDHWRFTDYFEQIKLFSEKYSIPLIMGNYCLNAWNRNLYIGDNVHPTEEGYKVVGRYIANQIEKFL